MEIDLALLADAATVDAAGKLNILGIFDRISAQGFPAPHPHLSLVLRFHAGLNEAGSHKVEIVLRDPDGAEVVRVSGEMQIGPGPLNAGGQVRVPQVLNLGRLVFPQPGPYAFDVSVDGEHQTSIPLTLHEAGGGGGIRA
ncbi:DUF6941 family protein [Gemmatimonadota bacterium]